MSYDEAFAPIEAHYKKIVMHDTWGHLFPEQPSYTGNLRVSYTIYGSIDILDESPQLPEGSPWWNSAANEFACKMSDDMERGEVSEFKILVDIVEHKELDEDNDDEDGPYYNEYKTIEITLLKKIVLVKPY